MSLNNKKVIVIGGTSGIGLAVAQAAALQGAELAIAPAARLSCKLLIKHPF